MYIIASKFYEAYVMRGFHLKVMYGLKPSHISAQWTSVYRIPWARLESGPSWYQLAVC